MKRTMTLGIIAFFGALIASSSAHACSASNCGGGTPTRVSEPSSLLLLAPALAAVAYAVRKKRTQ